jgi:hypothetical protein
VKRALILAFCLALLSAAPAAAAPSDLLIANHGYGVTVLGPMRPRVDAKMATAIRLFGADFLAPAGCRFIWPAIGLMARGANFGRGDPCEFVQYVTITGLRSHRWRTVRGLRVGNSLGRLRALYPRTTHHGLNWTLTRARSPFTRRASAVIWAIIRGGRVVALRAWVGGAGE